MKDLQIKTQNRRGGNPQFKDNLGYVTTFIDDDNKIVVDNYKGQGETYEQRNEPQVTIFAKGKAVFNGTFEELEKQLK